ncbi:zinc finger protein 664-like isoform X2 [Artemia franciscana]|uniref:zinc finger protein 664-like isoform X2 n=1 Tax=Artemia franciscana TaxID=6661 RepID=UPI0032DAA506
MDLPQILKMTDPITVSQDSFIKNEVEDVSPVDSEKLFHFPNHLLSPKREDVPLFNLPSISGPCKFEYDTQESKSSNNEGHFSPHVSGIHLQGITSLYVSKNPSTSGFSNECALESEGKSLGNQKAGLKSCMQSDKNRKLGRYQRTHKEKKSFNCEICDKIFFRKQHLKQHQRVHSGEKPFKCDVCKKRFSEQGNLNRHQRVHTGEKLFKCDVCDQTFSLAANLKTHQRIHTGEKPFKCKFCDKKFSHSPHLNLHQRVHSGEKPCKCNVCDKTFSHSSNLNRHQRVHLGEKPFKCDVCKISFSQLSSLNSHQRVHTDE